MYDIRTITSVELRDTESNSQVPTILNDRQWGQARRIVSIIGWHENMPSGYPKIEAIKLFRELTGLGLREAKMGIEAAWQCRG